MVRTQVQFEEAQYEQIRKLAHRQRVSISEVVRRLVGRGLAAGVDRPQVPRSSALLDIAGIAKGGPRDLGKRHDAYLDEDFAS
jgi:hypothetical protein